MISGLTSERSERKNPSLHFSPFRDSRNEIFSLSRESIDYTLFLYTLIEANIDERFKIQSSVIEEFAMIKGMTVTSGKIRLFHSVKHLTSLRTIVQESCQSPCDIFPSRDE